MKEKYSKITFTILMFIPILVSVFLLDRSVLPQETINDEIETYGKNFVTNSGKFSRSKVFIGYTFFTRKGYEFSTEKKFIQENEIEIKRSFIFQGITSVKSKKKDYSDKLMSGFNGACLYATIGLTISALISIVLLKFYDKLSENGFQNIILFNSLLAFYTLYILFLHN